MSATTVRRFPVKGTAYWAALATVGPTGWATVWGSYYGAQVDPEGAVKYGAALFATREAAAAYLAQYGPTMAPGAEDQAPVVAYVTYAGGTHYRTAPDPCGQPRIPWAEVAEDGAPAPVYPHTDGHGRTVWACCESSIGPTCQHLS